MKLRFRPSNKVYDLIITLEILKGVETKDGVYSKFKYTDIKEFLDNWEFEDEDK